MTGQLYLRLHLHWQDPVDLDLSVLESYVCNLSNTGMLGSESKGIELIFKYVHAAAHGEGATTTEAQY